MKKPLSKVAHNRPRPFFFITGLAAQTAQKQKSRTSKSPLMQDWVFRLGLEPFFISKHKCVFFSAHGKTLMTKVVFMMN